MVIDRAKNTGRNIVFGTLLKLYQTFMPFLLRTVMIYFLGVRYLGLSGLFTSLLQVLNLAELGVGSAMVYSMYKPVAEDDHRTICSLLMLYRYYYRVIGCVILAAGLVIMPFLPRLIHSDLPQGINLYVLYLLNLLSTVLSYWFFAYKSSVFQAHQRNDVISKIQILTATVQYILQLAAIALFRNYYFFTAALLISQLVNNLSVAWFSKRLYPSLNPGGEADDEMRSTIKKQIRDVFTSKFAFVVISSSDTIVISAFLGLSVLALYQNYYLIVAALISFVAILFNASLAGIGNSLIVESKEKNFWDLSVFTFLIFWISGFCSACLLCLYQPFITVWIGEEYLLSFEMVICFSVYFFVYEINRLLNNYKDAAGIWRIDRFRPLAAALANLVMNLIMVQYWGLYGIILSTILSIVIVGLPWLFHNLFTYVFPKEFLFPYLKKLLIYCLAAAAACVLTVLACSLPKLEGWALLIVRGCICCVIPNAMFYLLFRSTKEFRSALRLARQLTGGRKAR